MINPIVLFTYNRLSHLQKTIEALLVNYGADESSLFIYSDGPKNNSAVKDVNGVREYIKTITGFKNISIIESRENLGLAASIIKGVTEVVNRYGSVIVIEDDLITSPYFLEYMNDALETYKNDDGVISIHGYIYPVTRELPETFFLRGADCWGWATWKRGWDLFESDGKKLLKELNEKSLTKEFDFGGNYHFSDMLKRQSEGTTNSWAIRWYAGAFLKNKLTLYPGKSLVQNIGHDKTGTHGTQAKFYETKLSDRKIKVEKLEIKENKLARTIVTDYFKSMKPSFFKKILRKLKL